MYKRLILRIFLNQYYNSITTQKLSTKNHNNQPQSPHSFHKIITTYHQFPHSFHKIITTNYIIILFISHKSSLPTINNLIHFTQNIAVNTSSPHPFHTQNKNNPPLSKEHHKKTKQQTTINMIP